MTSATIFFVEDSITFRNEAARWLEAHSQHKVVLMASTLLEALSGVVQLQELGVNLVLLDNNLTPHGNEGKRIAEAIVQTGHPVVIIAISSDEQSWGNYNCLKPMRLENLLDLIAQIPEP